MRLKSGASYITLLGLHRCVRLVCGMLARLHAQRCVTDRSGTVEAVRTFAGVVGRLSVIGISAEAQRLKKKEEIF